MIGVMVRDAEKPKPTTETQEIAVIARDRVIAVIGKLDGQGLSMALWSYAKS
jgi:hypothetical protein